MNDTTTTCIGSSRAPLTPLPRPPTPSQQNRDQELPTPSNSEHTHFVIEKSGERLALRESQNGIFSITRNGEAVAGCRWSARELIAAITCFRALGRGDAGAVPQPTQRPPRAAAASRVSPPPGEPRV